MNIGTSLFSAWDTIKYVNAAGNLYSVNRINLYISSVIIRQSNGKSHISKKVFYIDPSISSKSFFDLDSIPPGAYTEITFLLGIDSSLNKTNFLPATIDNVNMAWPDMMGGGYHFMKFEGHYLDTAGAKKGYAFHIGRNVHLPTLTFSCLMNQKHVDHQYNLNFDLKEIFDTPYKYDLNIEKNYTMSDSVAMSRIKNNLFNAFSLNQIQ
jgi:hypothetical protein